MTWFQALLLGLVQGMTEFLPVSSSTHLKLARHLLGVPSDEHALFFDLMCHLGTLVATGVFFRKDLRELFRHRRDTLVQICIAMLPLLPLYMLTRPLRHGTWGWPFLGCTLLVTGAFLFLGERLCRLRPSTLARNRPIRDALFVGLCQGAALIPGISRSASTIASARVLGWSRLEAVRFSFLLAMPTILGGNCLCMVDMCVHGVSELPISLPSCLMGFTGACVSGLVVIGPAIRCLQRYGLHPFAWYCCVLGLGLSVIPVA